MIRVSRSDILSANGGTAEPAPAGTRVRARPPSKGGPGGQSASWRRTAGLIAILAGWQLVRDRRPRKRRGTGLNLAIAARTYLELVNRGAPYVNYGHVLDDNWPSRRTGEKLGGRVGANYRVYRRDLLRAGKV